MKTEIEVSRDYNPDDYINEYCKDCPAKCKQNTKVTVVVCPIKKKLLEKIKKQKEEF